MDYIRPDWPAPKHVHALTTLRHGGISQAPYDSFNLATHVGDNLAHVQQNRLQLQRDLQLKNTPVWLNQTHSNRVIRLEKTQTHYKPPDADGAYTQQTDCICAILTADCLPILLCDRAGSLVCALHAGWRGLCAGIIEHAIAALPVDPATLLAWIGPAIGFNAFEIGDDVKTQLLDHPSAPESAVIQNKAGRYYANLPALASARLIHSGLGKAHCFGGDRCTFYNTDYYSYRRDKQTGRQGSLIWINRD